MKTLKERLQEHKDIEVPYHVWTKFGDDVNCKMIALAGNTACLGGDYGNLEELRAAVEWYVIQLGGKVKWEK